MFDLSRSKGWLARRAIVLYHHRAGNHSKRETVHDREFKYLANMCYHMSCKEVSTDILLRPGIEKILDSTCNRHRHLILLLLKQGTVQTETDMMLRGEREVEEIETELTSDHLPKLEEAGYIEWARDTG